MITIGRPKKAIEKRISGKGYTAVQAGSLKYKIKGKDNLYEIDTETIRNKIDAYLRSCKDESGNYIKKISRQALYGILDIDTGTYSLWLKGYTNKEHIDSDGWTYNDKLAEAMRRGNNEILRFLVENDDKYNATKDIRLLETYGEISPQKQQIDAKIGVMDLGKWKKYSK